jgi:topoisomerase-4 subunit A
MMAEAAALAREIPLEAMIEREPITVILSQRGWIRALKGHADLASRRCRRSSRRATAPFFAFHAQTTDKLLLAADNGRVLHAGGGQAAGRARLRRAGAADGGSWRARTGIVGLLPASRRAARCWWPHPTGAAFVVKADGGRGRGNAQGEAGR